MEGEGGEGGTTGNMICARANLSAHTTRASNNSTLRALAQTEAHLRSLKAECFDENYFRGIAGNIIFMRVSKEMRANIAVRSALILYSSLLKYNSKIHNYL